MIVHVWKCSPRFRGTRSTGQWHCAPLHTDVLWQHCRCREPKEGRSVRYKIFIMQEKNEPRHSLSIHRCLPSGYTSLHSKQIWGCQTFPTVPVFNSNQSKCRETKGLLAETAADFKCTHSWIHSTLVLMLLWSKRTSPLVEAVATDFFFPAAPWWWRQWHSNGDRVFNTSHGKWGAPLKQPMRMKVLFFWGRHRGDSALT